MLFRGIEAEARRPGSARCAAPALIVLALAPASADGRPAAGRRMSSIRISDTDGASARRVDLGLGKSLIVDLPRDAKEVFVANPADRQRGRALGPQGLRHRRRRRPDQHVLHGRRGQPDRRPRRQRPARHQPDRRRDPAGRCPNRRSPSSSSMTASCSPASRPRPRTPSRPPRSPPNTPARRSWFPTRSRSGAATRSCSRLPSPRSSARCSSSSASMSPAPSRSPTRSSSFATDNPFPLTTQALTRGGAQTNGGGLDPIALTPQAGPFSGSQLPGLRADRRHEDAGRADADRGLGRERPLPRRRRGADAEGPDLRPERLHRRDRVQAGRRQPQLHAGRPQGGPHQPARLHRGHRARLPEHHRLQQRQRAVLPHPQGRHHRRHSLRRLAGHGRPDSELEPAGGQRHARA